MQILARFPAISMVIVPFGRVMIAGLLGLFFLRRALQRFRFAIAMFAASGHLLDLRQPATDLLRKLAKPIEDHAYSVHRYPKALLASIRSFVDTAISPRNVPV